MMYTPDTNDCAQVQSYNSAAIAWGALGKPLYAPGTRYGVSACRLLHTLCDAY